MAAPAAGQPSTGGTLPPTPSLYQSSDMGGPEVEQVGAIVPISRELQPAAARAAPGAAQDEAARELNECRVCIDGEYAQVVWVESGGTRLGGGGFGDVYRGEIRGGARTRPCALKRAKRQADPSWLQEVRILMELQRKGNQENIVHVYGVSDDMSVLVMELMPGSLKSVVHQGGRQQPLEMGMLFVIAQQILRPMRYCHNLQPPVYHRDLKPDNVLVDVDREVPLVKVADWGSGKEQWGDLAGDTRAPFTPFYLCPEALVYDSFCIDERRKASQAGTSPRMYVNPRRTHAADVYAFGCILLEMYTGKPPWHDVFPYEYDCLFHLVNIFRSGKSLPTPRHRKLAASEASARRIPDDLREVMEKCVEWQGPDNWFGAHRQRPSCDALAGMPFFRREVPPPEDETTPAEVGPALSAPPRSQETQPAAEGVPHPWTDASDLSQGWRAAPVADTTPVFLALKNSLLNTKKEWLGLGRDAGGGRYDKLVLQRAWRIENPNQWKQYSIAREAVADAVKHKRLGKKDLKLRQETADTLGPKGTALPDALRGGGVNEVRLFHGTRPDVLLSILNDGLNERFSGTNAGSLFGAGLYFAEDPGKSDHYVREHAPGSDPDLERRLYRAGVTQPGTVFYVLVCRVVCGDFAVTVDGKTLTTGGTLWATPHQRELVRTPTGDHYTSLLAELGSFIVRYREFILFRGQRAYPEYLLAYTRE